MPNLNRVQPVPLTRHVWEVKGTEAHVKGHHEDTTGQMQDAGCPAGAWPALLDKNVTLKREEGEG